MACRTCSFVVDRRHASPRLLTARADCLDAAAHCHSDGVRELALQGKQRLWWCRCRCTRAGMTSASLARQHWLAGLPMCMLCAAGAPWLVDQASKARTQTCFVARIAPRPKSHRRASRMTHHPRGSSGCRERRHVDSTAFEWLQAVHQTCHGQRVRSLSMKSGAPATTDAKTVQLLTCPLGGRPASSRLCFELATGNASTLMRTFAAALSEVCLIW